MSEEAKSRLENARKSHRKNPASQAKNIAKQTLSALKYAEILDYLFVGIAIAVGLLKDILDFTPLGLPGISLVLTFIASFTIWACMFIIGASTSRAKTKQALGRVFKKYGSLILGSILEILFGLEFLPIETIVVIYMYWQTLLERQAATEVSAAE